MVAVVPLVSALALLLHGCHALGGLRYLRPPTAHSLAARAGVESIEQGVVNWSNTTTPENSAIVPVALAEDGQCAPLSLMCIHFA